MSHRQELTARICCLLAAATVSAGAYTCRQPLRDGAWIGLLRLGLPAWRLRAAAELGQGDARRAAPHLVRTLREDPDQRVRDAAADALGALGPTVGDPAIAALVEAFLPHSLPWGL